MSERRSLDRLLLPKMRVEPEGVELLVPESSAPLPRWQTLPLDAKFPVTPAAKDEVTFVTTRICQPLLEQNLLTPSGKVPCTVRDFNNYRNFRRRQALIKSKEPETLTRATENRNMILRKTKMKAELVGVEVTCRSLKAQQMMKEAEEEKQRQFWRKQFREVEREQKRLEEEKKSRDELAKKRRGKWIEKQKEIREKEENTRKEHEQKVMQIELEAQEKLNKVDTMRQDRQHLLEARRKQQWDQKRQYQMKVLEETMMQQKRVESEMGMRRRQYEDKMASSLVKYQGASGDIPGVDEILETGHNDGAKFITGQEKVQMGQQKYEPEMNLSRRGSMWIIEELLYSSGMIEEANLLFSSSNPQEYSHMLDKLVGSVMRKTKSSSVLGMEQDALSKIIHLVVRQLEAAYHRKEQRELDQDSATVADEEAECMKRFFAGMDVSLETERAQHVAMSATLDLDWSLSDNRPDRHGHQDERASLFANHLRLQESDVMEMEADLAQLLTHFQKATRTASELKSLVGMFLKLACHDATEAPESGGELGHNNGKITVEHVIPSLGSNDLLPEATECMSLQNGGRTSVGSVGSCMEKLQLGGEEHACEDTQVLAASEEKETDTRRRGCNNEALEDVCGSETNPQSIKMQSAIKSTEELVMVSSQPSVERTEDDVDEIMSGSGTIDNTANKPRNSQRPDINNSPSDSGADIHDNHVIDSSSWGVSQNTANANNPECNNCKGNVQTRARDEKTFVEPALSTDKVDGSVSMHVEDLAWQQPLAESVAEFTNSTHNISSICSLTRDPNEPSTLASESIQRVDFAEGKELGSRMQLAQQAKEEDNSDVQNKDSEVESDVNKERQSNHTFQVSAGESRGEINTELRVSSTILTTGGKSVQDNANVAQRAATQKATIVKSGGESNIVSMAAQFVTKMQQRELQGVGFPPAKIHYLITMFLSRLWQRVGPEETDHHDFGTGLYNPDVARTVQSLINSVRTMRLPAELVHILTNAIVTAVLHNLADYKCCLPEGAVKTTIHGLDKGLEQHHVSVRLLEDVLFLLQEQFGGYFRCRQSFQVDVFLVEILSTAEELLSKGKVVGKDFVKNIWDYARLSRQSQVTLLYSPWKSLLHQAKVAIELSITSPEDKARLEYVILSCGEKLTGAALDHVSQCLEQLRALMESEVFKVRSAVILSASVVAALLHTVEARRITGLTLLPGALMSRSMLSPGTLGQDSTGEAVVLLTLDSLARDMGEDSLGRPCLGHIAASLLDLFRRQYGYQKEALEDEGLAGGLDCMTSRFRCKSLEFTDSCQILSAVLRPYLGCLLMEDEDLGFKVDLGQLVCVDEDLLSSLFDFITEVFVTFVRGMVARMRYRWVGNHLHDDLLVLYVWRTMANLAKEANTLLHHNHDSVKGQHSTVKSARWNLSVLLGLVDTFRGRHHENAVCRKSDSSSSGDSRGEDCVQGSTADSRRENCVQGSTADSRRENCVQGSTADSRGENCVQGSTADSRGQNCVQGSTADSRGENCVQGSTGDSRGENCVQGSADMVDGFMACMARHLPEPGYVPVPDLSMSSQALSNDSVAAIMSKAMKRETIPAEVETAARREIISACKPIFESLVMAEALQGMRDKLARHVACAVFLMDRLTTILSDKMWTLKERLGNNSLKVNDMIPLLVTCQSQTHLDVVISKEAAFKTLTLVILELETVQKSVSVLCKIVDRLTGIGQQLTEVKGYATSILSAISSSTLTLFIRSFITYVLKLMAWLVDRIVHEKASTRMGAPLSSYTSDVSKLTIDVVCDGVKSLRQVARKEAKTDDRWGPMNAAGSAQDSLLRIPNEVCDNVLGCITDMIESEGSTENDSEMDTPSPSDVVAYLISRVLTAATAFAGTGKDHYMCVNDLLRSEKPCNTDKQREATDAGGNNASTRQKPEITDLLTRVEQKESEHLLNLLTQTLTSIGNILKQEINAAVLASKSSDSLLQAFAFVNVKLGKVQHDLAKTCITLSNQQPGVSFPSDVGKHLGVKSGVGESGRITNTIPIEARKADDRQMTLSQYIENLLRNVTDVKQTNKGLNIHPARVIKAIIKACYAVDVSCLVTDSPAMNTSGVNAQSVLLIEIMINELYNRLTELEKARTKEIDKRTHYPYLFSRIYTRPDPWGPYYSDVAVRARHLTDTVRVGSVTRNQVQRLSAVSSLISSKEESVTCESSHADENVSSIVCGDGTAGSDAVHVKRPSRGRRRQTRAATWRRKVQDCSSVHNTDNTLKLWVRNETKMSQKLSGFQKKFQMHGTAKQINAATVPSVDNADKLEKINPEDSQAKNDQHNLQCGKRLVSAQNVDRKDQKLSQPDVKSCSQKVVAGKTDDSSKQQMKQKYEKNKDTLKKTKDASSKICGKMRETAAQKHISRMTRRSTSVKGRTKSTEHGSSNVWPRTVHIIHHAYTERLSATEPLKHGENPAALACIDESLNQRKEGQPKESQTKLKSQGLSELIEAHPCALRQPASTRVLMSLLAKELPQQTMAVCRCLENEALEALGHADLVNALSVVDHALLELDLGDELQAKRVLEGDCGQDKVSQRAAAAINNLLRSVTTNIISDEDIQMKLAEVGTVCEGDEVHSFRQQLITWLSLMAERAEEGVTVPWVLSGRQAEVLNALRYVREMSQTTEGTGPPEIPEGNSYESDGGSTAAEYHYTGSKTNSNSLTPSCNTALTSVSASEDDSNDDKCIISSSWTILSSCPSLSSSRSSNVVRAGRADSAAEGHQRSRQPMRSPNAGGFSEGSKEGQLSGGNSRTEIAGDIKDGCRPGERDFIDNDDYGRSSRKDSECHPSEDEPVSGRSSRAAVSVKSEVRQPPGTSSRAESNADDHNDWPVSGDSSKTGSGHHLEDRPAAERPYSRQESRPASGLSSWSSSPKSSRCSSARSSRNEVASSRAHTPSSISTRSGKHKDTRASSRSSRSAASLEPDDATHSVSVGNMSARSIGARDRNSSIDRSLDDPSDNQGQSQEHSQSGRVIMEATDQQDSYNDRYSTDDDSCASEAEDGCQHGKKMDTSGEVDPMGGGDIGGDDKDNEI